MDENNSNGDLPNSHRILINNSDNDSEKSSSKKVNIVEEKKTPEQILELGNEIVDNFVKIKKCSILKYGIKVSPIKIEYGFCNTCDINLMHPICSACLEKCHLKFHHNIKKVTEPKNIICGCGERMHHFQLLTKKSNLMKSNKCPYSDFCEKSKSTNLYVVDGVYICEFCYHLCGYEGKGELYDKQEEIPRVCECESLNGSITHIDLKLIYKKFEDAIIQDSNKILNIDPTEFMNLLFISKTGYEYLFNNFEEMIQSFYLLEEGNKMNLKDNFTSSNFYKILTIFTEIVEKNTNTPIRYYVPEIVEKLSFSLIQNVIKFVEYKDTKSYWNFFSKLLYLYKKVNIGCCTMYMDKYKLYDLENFSPLQRKCVYHNNPTIFPGATEQIDFFIDFLDNLLVQEIKSIEGYDVIIQICAILKRLSVFYLFNSMNMTKFCFVLDKMFSFFHKQKSMAKQIELYYIIIKMLTFFIYFHNDNCYYTFVTENKKEDLSKVKFVYHKNELGRLISRNVIRIMYFILIVSKCNTLNRRQKVLTERIQYYGIKILSLLLTEKDSYFLLNQEKENHQYEFLKIISIQTYDPKYKLLINEVNNIEQIYLDYFSFEADKKYVVQELDISLDKILIAAKSGDLRGYIAKTNYFFLICKVLYIIDFNDKENNKENDKEDKKEDNKENSKEISKDSNIDGEEIEINHSFISHLFSFLFYFIEDNADNAILITCHYIINVLLKLPDDYALEIFKLYAKCSNLISKKKGYICHPEKIIENLFDYLVKYKQNSEEKWSKEAKDFFINDVTLLDQIQFLFLNTIVKLFLETKLLYPLQSNKSLKILLTKMFGIFKYPEAINYNLCLGLVLANKIFEPSLEKDRKTILKLCPINNLTCLLEDTNIELDFRIEILLFIHKFKCSIALKQEEAKNHSFKKSVTKISGIEKPKASGRKSVLFKPTDFSLITDSASGEISNKSNNAHIHNIHITHDNTKNRRNSFVNRENSDVLIKRDLQLVKEKIYDMDINTLFNLSNEEKMKKNNYLNAIIQDFDEFVNIKNLRLISNNQMPTKYLSFYYFLIKSDETGCNSIFKNIEFGIDLFEQELKRFIDIFKKNSNRPAKIFKFYVKGILLPVLSLIKLLFCFTAKANGTILLKLFKIIMKMLYIKNFVIDMYNTLTANKTIKIPDFDNFDFEKFMSPEKQDEPLKDYFILKDLNKFSPYDYTHLWDIFERNFLNYIRYPESIKLEEEFPPKHTDFVSYGNMTEETDLLEDLSLKARKKMGSSIFSRDFDKKKRGSVDTNLNELQKSVAISRSNNNKFYNSSRRNFAITEVHYGSKNMTSKLLNFGLKGNTEQEKENFLSIKVKKIYNFYINEKINIKEEDSSLLISLGEMCTEYEVNFRRMLLCLMVNLSKENDENFYLCWSVIYKLLLVATVDTQKNIIENLGEVRKKDLGFIVNMNNKLYRTLLKILVNDFCYEFTKYKSNQINIMLISKIFKLLCLEHNNYFQEKFLLALDFNYTRLIGNKRLFVLNKSYSLLSPQVPEEVSNTSKGGKINGTTGFFDFLIFILQKILLISNSATEMGHLNYLYDIFYGIIELLVEIIQGNKTEILIKSKDKDEEDTRNTYTLYSFKAFVTVATQILFNDNLLAGPGFRTRLLLISFFIAILEEKTNEEIQKIIMKHLALNKVLSSVKYTLKNYFYEKTYNNPKYERYYSDYSNKEILQKEFVFDHNLYEFYKRQYFNKESCKESKEFELASSYYRYIKKLSISEKSHEAEDLVKQVNKLSLEEAKKKFELFNKKIIKSNAVTPINLINEKEKFISTTFIENYYLIKFFESITKIVEIRLPKEQRNVKVIFTVPCEIMHLTEMTKSEFVRLVDRSSETSKKFELVRSIPLFQLEIEYFKNTKIGILSKLILKMDYVYVQIIMYLYATVFLILMLFTLEGYKEIRPDESVSEDDRRLRNLYWLRKLYTIPEEITYSIDQSIDEWGRIYDIIDYLFCFLNGFLILSWILVKSPLYYILDKFIYIEENKLKSEEELTIWDKLFIGLYKTIIGRDYITTLIFMFIISLIGAIMTRGEITYAFCLLAVLNLNKTLRGIAVSIKDRGPELGASFLLLIFLVYFYSNIGFFYFNANYAADIEDDVPDNYCLCLSFCFMTNFDAGIRARGGAADQMVRVSFGRNRINYITRVIFDVSYFLINIIIMIDLVFGIILGTFSEMREEERKHDSDKINHCFLCHITREMAKKRKEDFNYHREKKHYLWDYVEYMMFLKFSDLHTLNAINSYSRNNLDKKNICFLPSCQDQFQEESENQNVAENNNDEEDEISDTSEYMTSWDNSEISGKNSSDSFGEEEEEEEEELEEIENEDEEEEEEEEIELIRSYDDEKEESKNSGEGDDVIVNENMII